MQWTLFFTNMLLLVGALRNMTVWHGKGALDMHHDYLLQADLPRRDRLRANYAIIIVWGLLEALALVTMISAVRAARCGGVNVAPAAGVHGRGM